MLTVPLPNTVTRIVENLNLFKSLVHFFIKENLLFDYHTQHVIFKLNRSHYCINEALNTPTLNSPKIFTTLSHNVTQLKVIPYQSMITCKNYVTSFIYTAQPCLKQRGISSSLTHD
jgi:hypothetical protein